MLDKRGDMLSEERLVKSRFVEKCSLSNEQVKLMIGDSIFSPFLLFFFVCVQLYSLTILIAIFLFCSHGDSAWFWWNQAKGARQTCF